MKKVAKKRHSIIFSMSFVLGFLMLMSIAQNLYTLNNGGTWTGVIWSSIFMAIFAGVIIYIKKHYAIIEFLNKDAEKIK